MPLQFTTAVKTSAKLRMALIGISGSGKTYSALRIATGMGGPIAVIDTEHGRASAYAHRFAFDVLTLTSFSPHLYIEAIEAAAAADYAVLIIDSLSHAWMGKGGALELVDKAARSARSQNTFTAWRDVTPLHNRLVEAITTSRLHVIATMRQKAKYDLEKDDKGKMVPVKVGMEPVQREGLEYEFDLVGDLDIAHNYVVSKSTLDSIHPRDVIQIPDEMFGELVLADLTGRGTLPERRTASEERAKPDAGQPTALKRLWASLKAHQVDQEAFRAWLKAEWDIESTKGLAEEQVRYLVGLLEDQGAAAFARRSEADRRVDLSVHTPFATAMAQGATMPDHGWRQALRADVERLHARQPAHPVIAACLKAMMDLQTPPGHGEHLLHKVADALLATEEGAHAENAVP